MAHPRKFRFGVELHGPLAGMDWFETVQRVEDLGYSTLFLPDHFDDQLGPFTAMAAAAARSKTLNIGSLVLDNDYRHPVVVAKEMATLDVLSGGRVELGIGAGWKAEDYVMSGIPHDTPKVRVDRLMESVAVLQGLFSGEAFNFDGDYYNISGLAGRPLPHVAGGPPFLIAGGARRMLRFAGANASIVGVNPSIHSGAIDADAARDSLGDRMDQKFEWVREGAGDRYDELEFNAWVAVAAITDDVEGFAALIAPEFGLSADVALEALESPMTLVGSVQQIIERIHARRERWGFSYHVVRDDAVESMAPVVAALAGQ